MTVGGIGSGVVADAEALQHRKLTDAAQQFEGMFLQQLLKPLSAKEDGEQDEDAGSGGSTYQSLGVEAMAKAVAAGGGMGIAKSVVKQVELEQHQRHEEATKVGQG